MSGNQFDVLSSPVEGKQQHDTRRGGKDDVKEQVHQARTQLKGKATQLKEEVLESNTGRNVLASASSALQQGIDLVKEKAGISKDVSNEELLDDVSQQAGEQWSEVKQRGSKAAKKAADQVDAKLNQNLTKQQKAQLQAGLQQAKKNAVRLERQAEGWSERLLDMTILSLPLPMMRPIKSFVRRNHLALPVVLLTTILTLWMGLSLLRLTASIWAAPAVPEFDIRSPSAMEAYAKYHAGELKGKALDARHSITGRAAAFLANHEWDQMKNSAMAQAIDWREIGMSKLGLQEPTWGEWAYAKLTGRPITWQERVTSVLDLTKSGLAMKAAKAGAKMAMPGSTILGGIKHMLHKEEEPEPTLMDRAGGVLDSIRSTLRPEPEPVGIVDGIKNSLRDGVDQIRSHLPGGEPIEVIRQRAYDAAHPSTINQIKSGAEYVKNRIVHGSQEAAHIAQDRANELADKAKYKTGL